MIPYPTNNMAMVAHYQAYRVWGGLHRPLSSGVFTPAGLNAAGVIDQRAKVNTITWRQPKAKQEHTR